MLFLSLFTPLERNLRLRLFQSFLDLRENLNRSRKADTFLALLQNGNQHSASNDDDAANPCCASRNLMKQEVAKKERENQLKIAQWHKSRNIRRLKRLEHANLNQVSPHSKQCQESQLLQGNGRPRHQRRNNKKKRCPQAEIKQHRGNRILIGQFSSHKRDNRIHQCAQNRQSNPDIKRREILIGHDNDTQKTKKSTSQSGTINFFTKENSCQTQDEQRFCKRNASILEQRNTDNRKGIHAQGHRAKDSTPGVHFKAMRLEIKSSTTQHKRQNRKHRKEASNKGHLSRTKILTEIKCQGIIRGAREIKGHKPSCRQNIIRRPMERWCPKAMRCRTGRSVRRIHKASTSQRSQPFFSIARFF